MPEPIRVVYLSYDGLTDQLGQSQIIPYLIELTKNGYRFTVISFEKRNKFAELSDAIYSQLNEVGIQWEPLRYTKWPPVISTVWDVWRLWKSFVKMNSKKSFHIVHCRSYITSLVGRKAKKMFGTKFLFDMRGFWADERVEGGLWNLSNPMYRLVYNFFKKQEKRFLIESDYTVSLTENAKQEILSRGLPVSPISIIPTCVDLNLFNHEKIDKESKDRLRTQLGIKSDDFVLLYLGSWGTWYLTNEMLDFFSVLKKQKRSAKFLIVCSDAVDLNKYPHRNDVIITQCSRNLVPLHISITQLAVCFIKPTFSKKASSATKLAEIMAMNVPVICNPGWGDIDEMTSKTGIRIYTRDKPINLLFEASPDDHKNFVVNNLSLSTGVKKYIDVYRSLIGQ